MRKAQQAAVAGRPYADLMNRVLAEVTKDEKDFTHALLEIREVRKRCVIVISTDKGLCGSLNSWKSIVRSAVVLPLPVVPGKCRCRSMPPGQEISRAR